MDNNFSTGYARLIGCLSDILDGMIIKTDNAKEIGAVDRDRLSKMRELLLEIQFIDDPEP